MKRTPLKRKTTLKRGGPIKRNPQRDGRLRKYHKFLPGAFSQLKPKKRKPIKQRSKKRSAEEGVYSKRSKEFLKDRCACQVCQDEVMRGDRSVASASTEVHHMGRRQGKWLLDERFWLPVCIPHHRLIEENGTWARKNGYLLTPEQRRLVTWPQSHRNGS